jgi:hypothetical protein
VSIANDAAHFPSCERSGLAADLQRHGVALHAVLDLDFVSPFERDVYIATWRMIWKQALCERAA